MRFTSGMVSLEMNIEDGLITQLKLYGDFFEENPKEILENLFIGEKYDLVVIRNIIEKADVSRYIHKLSNDEFIELFF